MNFVEEVCPYCDEAVTVTAYEGIIRCPYCGKYMVICSMCGLPACMHCELEDIEKELNESEADNEAN